MSKKHPRPGRLIINEFKSLYSAGADLSKTDLIGIAKKYHPRPRTVTAVHVNDWSRKAVLELAAAGVSVTNPTFGNNYHRSSVADPVDRQASRVARRKDTLTRVRNDELETFADSQRADATAVEKELPNLLRMSREMLETVDRLS